MNEPKNTDKTKTLFELWWERQPDSVKNSDPEVIARLAWSGGAVVASQGVLAALMENPTTKLATEWAVAVKVVDEGVDEETEEIFDARLLDEKD